MIFETYRALLVANRLQAQRKRLVLIRGSCFGSFDCYIRGMDTEARSIEPYEASDVNLATGHAVTGGFVRSQVYIDAPHSPTGSVFEPTSVIPDVRYDTQGCAKSHVWHSAPILPLGRYGALSCQWVNEQIANKSVRKP